MSHPNIRPSMGAFPSARIAATASRPPNPWRTSPSPQDTDNSRLNRYLGRRDIDLAPRPGATPSHITTCWTWTQTEGLLPPTSTSTPCARWQPNGWIACSSSASCNATGMVLSTSSSHSTPGMGRWTLLHRTFRMGRPFGSGGIAAEVVVLEEGGACNNQPPRWPLQRSIIVLILELLAVLLLSQFYVGRSECRCTAAITLI